MLKERHRYGVPATTSRRRYGDPAEVGLIPGNRFFLLPLKKVTAFVRPHTPCREPSAISTKPCIVAKPSRSTQAPVQAASKLSVNSIHVQQYYSQQAHHSKRLRHRRCLVAKTRLSPVSEQREPLLENWPRNIVDTRIVVQQQQRSRSKDTSVFTLNVDPNLSMGHKKLSTTGLIYNVSDLELLRYRKSSVTKTRFSSDDRRGLDQSKLRFGRNNRVSPSNYPELHLRGATVSTDQVGKLAPCKRRNHGDYVGCSETTGKVSHQIRSSSPFLCSFTNENDLPIDPPLPQFSRRSSWQPKASGALVAAN